MKKEMFRETHAQLAKEVDEMLEIVPEEPEVVVVEEHVEEEKVEAKRRGRKRSI